MWNVYDLLISMTFMICTKMLSQAVSGPEIREFNFRGAALACVSPNHVYSCNMVLWYLRLCMFNAVLDLEALPHMLQAWEIPVIWFASMWLGIWLVDNSFPQMLHEATNLFPSAVRTSVVVIIDLICWSRSPLFEFRAIVVSGFSEIWSSTFGLLCLTFSLFIGAS